MMAGFNFLSHGTQDIYPTFLEQQRHLDTHQVGSIALVYNLGAMLGGIFFGILSEKIGRKRAIAAAAFLVLPVIPFWVGAQTVYGLAFGAFLIQFFAQGAWGVVPVHLNEISPQEIRGTFPGFAYQLGNLLASYNATLQAGIAERLHGAYGVALTLIAATAAVAVVTLSLLGYEAKGRIFEASDDAPLKRKAQ
jgi:SHS family lactate transporter-like MFS transporter